ncbi:MAG TPA: amidohydrolase family protein [Candidatus Limiplasma sp.]|nr:amidohydrolase family protein [Candidatus Limiplasma sp.]
MKFFDANAAFGPVRIPAPGIGTGVRTLLEQMDRFGIETALAYHSLSREYDPDTGNDALLEVCAQNRRILPVFTLLAPASGETAKLDMLLSRLSRSGVRAVTMFPASGYHNFSLRRWSVGPLLDALGETHVPLLIGLDQFGGNLEALGDFALSYPTLTVIATGINFRSDRMLYPLMEHTENLYAETSAYKPYRGIAEFCARFGAERLVFGSGMLSTDPASSVALITYAEISDADKEKIAHENLERLLSKVTL